MENSSAKPQRPATPPIEVVFEKQLTQFTQLFRLLRQAGLSSDDFQKPIDDPEMRERLVRTWIAGVPESGARAVPILNYQPSPSEKRARGIMGRNYLGIEEVVRYFGAAFTEEQLAALAEIPFSEAVLEECKDTHILVAGFSMTILDVRATAPSRKPRTFYSYNDAWYNSQAFAKHEKVEVRWYLIRKEAVANSTSKNFSEQKALLSEYEEVPRACELTYAVVLYFLATGERLFESTYVRCSDVDLGGHRVNVGIFRADGLNVSYYWDGNRLDSLGVSSAQKSN